jgi:hypothetical protein
MSHSCDDFKRNPFLATEDIGDILRDGSLMLFLGAGVSSGFGLPSWANLIARLLGREADGAYVKKLKGMSDKELARLVDKLDDSSKSYLDKVREALYRKVAKELTDLLARSPLLLAVAALITGSRRGRVTTVITYNYDDLLGQYLQMLGYFICVRTEYSKLTTWADAEINHVHGYLPQHSKETSDPKKFILSEKSYRSRRAAIDKEWSSYVEHCLYSKVGLFLGLSGDDSSILDILQRVKDRIGRRRGSNGFWLMTPASFRRNHKQIIDVGMCPIKLEEEEFPRFVFKVCQEAAQIA